jgi:hypothetical protein
MRPSQLKTGHSRSTSFIVFMLENEPTYISKVRSPEERTERGGRSKIPPRLRAFSQRILLVCAIEHLLGVDELHAKCNQSACC